jgi:hypothetical protein
MPITHHSCKSTFRATRLVWNPHGHRHKETRMRSHTCSFTNRRMMARVRKPHAKHAKHALYNGQIVKGTGHRAQGTGQQERVPQQGGTLPDRKPEACPCSPRLSFRLLSLYLLALKPGSLRDNYDCVHTTRPRCYRGIRRQHRYDSHGGASN